MKPQNWFAMGFVSAGITIWLMHWFDPLTPNFSPLTLGVLLMLFAIQLSYFWMRGKNL